MTLTRWPTGVLTLTVCTLLVGCQQTDRQSTERALARPPSPIDSIPITSDVRIDPNNRLLGSFVGEGTSRALHLLSNDTALIAALYRRYGPPLSRGESVWSGLARVGLTAIQGGDGTTGPLIQEPLASFAGGLASVAPRSIVLRGNRCGSSGALAEIIVGGAEDTDRSVSLGPVLGSFQTQPRTDLAQGEVMARRPTPLPQPALLDSLITRSERVVDSLIEPRLPDDALPLQVTGHQPPEINSLADIDAADVIPLWGRDDRVHYAVALRVRRATVLADTLLVSAVLIWDSAGRTVRTILRPTILGLSAGQLSPFGNERRSMYWRRLEAISGFGSGRDYLWLEQVDPSDASIIWGVVSPATNTVVAAARVAGPCDQ